MIYIGDLGFKTNEIRQYFDRYGILNAEIEKIIDKHPVMAVSLYCLHRGNILTPENQMTVCKQLSKHADDIAKALIKFILPDSELYVTQNNFYLLCAHPEQAPSIASILRWLTRANIDPNDQITFCEQNTKYVDDIAHAFDLLFHANILHQDNCYFCKKLFNTMYKHAEYIQGVIVALDFLHIANGLSRDNIDTLLADPQRALFTAERIALSNSQVMINKSIFRSNKPYLDFCEIRKAARIIGQGNRDKEEHGVEEAAHDDQDSPQNRFRFFSKLPPEICIKIAGLCGEGNLDQNTAEYVVKQTFDRPQVNI
ncbi:MAG: hypothetical protein AMJ43_03450 [Coxiella sp. DG_40]|nr:MAG: hypothetical protein AMJ43_03450 [Coxiella sp. DG_40]